MESQILHIKRDIIFRDLTLRYGLTCPPVRDCVGTRLQFYKRIGEPLLFKEMRWERTSWMAEQHVIILMQSKNPDWFFVLVDDAVSDIEYGFIPVIILHIDTMLSHQAALYFCNRTMYLIDSNGIGDLYSEEITALKKLTKHLRKRWGGVMAFDINLENTHYGGGNCVPATLVILLAIAAIGPRNAIRFLRSMSREQLSLAYARIYMQHENIFAPIAIPRMITDLPADMQNLVISRLASRDVVAEQFAMRLIHIDNRNHLITKHVYTHTHILCKMETHSCNDLLEAAREGHDECIQKLIVAGANLNITDNLGLGWTPLQWVSHRGFDTCLKILITAGVNISATDEFGRTPLHWATISLRNDCVQTLIDAGADPNVVNVDGNTPLHYAASARPDTCIPCIQTLIVAGANPNITDVRGKTPLHWAVICDREKCVATLIASGADPNIADNKGETPLQLAVRKERMGCVKILIIRILADRALTDDEWDLVPPNSDIGYLLSVVMARDGRDAAAKLVARLPKEKQKVLETAAMCLSRFVSYDVMEHILVRCV